MEDILKAMQDYDNDPEVKRAAMRHAFIWEDKDDKPYELIHEETCWKSVFNGKTLVMASTKDACIRQTEHYLSMFNKVIDDKYNYDTYSK